jgi:predicted GH43/DUF377 family glycosyl hydrolase
VTTTTHIASDHVVTSDAGVRILPDPTRVITKLFVPGQEFAGAEDPRRTGVADRVLGLDDRAVSSELAEIVAAFGPRHHALEDTFAQHGQLMSARLANAGSMSRERRLLLGAAFTCEQSVEAAAICNPSMVRHPDQSGLSADEFRFIMSMRGIAEGHRSSISFLSGTVDEEGSVRIDPRDPFPVTPRVGRGELSRDSFHRHLADIGQDGESAASVLDRFDERFSVDEFELELHRLRYQRDSQLASNRTADRLQGYAERHFVLEFPTDVSLSRRVIVPASASESCGVEDARFVQFGEGPDARYLATYTAFDGHTISQQLLDTTDFCTFTSAPLVGEAAANKGLAIFPRMVNGRYLALSRFDRESNSIAMSDDLTFWGESVPLPAPSAPWELVQVGNCGSPIETPAGWLVLTHGVGPVRTYRIGAMLLDLDDPTKVIGELDHPLIVPDEAERDGYVPNVVYSCGALRHAGNLVIPYGVADHSIAIATVAIADLIGAMG